MSKPSRKELRSKRHRRARHYLHGTTERPRLAVYRSLKHIYAQIIDDSRGVTLAAASSMEPGLRSEQIGGCNKEAAHRVGKMLAEKAKANGIHQVVFDRGGLIYHGRVAAVAEGAREAGLDF